MADMDYIGSALSASRPSDFPKIFNKLPPALRAVAIEAPDDVTTDIKSIVDKDERMAMTKRIGSTEKTNVKRSGVKRRNWHEQEMSRKRSPKSKRCQEK